jgi:hypothetical protein
VEEVRPLVDAVVPKNHVEDLLEVLARLTDAGSMLDDQSEPSI